MKRTLITGLLILVVLASCTPARTPIPVATTTASVPMVSTQASTAEPVWSEGDYFPRFPQPRQIYVIRVETGLEYWWSDPNQPNWRVNQSDEVMVALTLVGMQGVINRSDPAVYLDWQDSGMLGNAAHFWLTPLAEQVDLVPLDVEGSSAVEFLWENFSPRFKGAVIYDPDVPDTINLATMLAGLEDRLILAPDQLTAPIIQTILTALEGNCSPDSNPLNLRTLSGNQCVTDLRLLVQQQGWIEPPGNREILQENRYLIYQWVYDNLWARLEKRAIGMVSPGAPSSHWLENTQTYYDPIGLAWRDYLIALRLPALWLSTVDEPESRLLEHFLDDAPSPIPLLSFYDHTEVESTAMASRHGDWIPVISNSNTPISTGNLTILSAIDMPVQSFQPRLDADHLFAALGNMPLVTLWSSDGDAIQYILDRGFYDVFSWEDVSGNVFGFSINPTLANLSPLAWNYYIKTAGRTSFVAGLSGAGYMYPALMSDTQLDDYLEHTARLMDLTGIRTLSVDERKGAFDDRLGSLYYQRLKPAGYLGTFGTFLFGPQGSVTYSYPGAPTPVVRLAYELKYGNGNQILQNLFGGEPGSIFLDLPTYSSQGKVISDSDAQGSQAVRFSRPDLSNCCLVVAGPLMTLAPGTYTATYRLKVTENQSSISFAHLMLLRQAGGGQNLADRYIAPSDFAQVGEWQGLSVVFSLNEFVSDVQLWLDYMGGTSGNTNTDLYADTITLSRAGGPALPIVAPMSIGLVGSGGPLNEDLRLVIEEVERRGGVLLNPDEFMAALNPEFMIGWATPILGSDNPALVEAQYLLDNQQFLQSLYTVREALRAFPERAYVSSDGSVTVQANAWITDLELDEQVHSLTFKTHGSPTADLSIRIQLPEGLLGLSPKVMIDGKSIIITLSSDGTLQHVEFILPGGLHDVQVMKP